MLKKTLRCLLLGLVVTTLLNIPAIALAHPLASDVQEADEAAQVTFSEIEIIVTDYSRGSPSTRAVCCTGEKIVFKPAPIGQMSINRFTIRNIGTKAFDVSSVSLQHPPSSAVSWGMGIPFWNWPPTLQPGQSVSVIILVTKNQPGIYQSFVNIANNADFGPDGFTACTDFCP